MRPALIQSDFKKPSVSPVGSLDREPFRRRAVGRPDEGRLDSQKLEQWVGVLGQPGCVEADAVDEHRGHAGGSLLNAGSR